MCAFPMTAVLQRLALIALVAFFAAATAHAQLIGATLAISGPGCRFPDVAYGNVSRQYLVVWADYGGGAVRIWGALLRGDGTAVAAAFPISDAGFAGLFPPSRSMRRTTSSLSRGTTAGTVAE
jgi:hypothetical protein